MNRSRAEVYGVVTFYHDFTASGGPAHREDLSRRILSGRGTDELCRHAERRSAAAGRDNGRWVITLERFSVSATARCRRPLWSTKDFTAASIAERFDEIVAGLSTEAAE